MIALVDLKSSKIWKPAPERRKFFVPGLSYTVLRSSLRVGVFSNGALVIFARVLNIL